MSNDKIKFPALEKKEFIKELRAQVAAYFESKSISKFGSWRLVVKSVFMLTLYIFPYVLMMTGVISSFAGVFACWVLIGLGKAGVGMDVMHDAMHRSYSENQTVNKWMGNTLYLLGGFPANWQHQHNTLHHGFTNIEGHDEDIDPGAFLRISPHKPYYKIYKFQHIYAWFLYGLMTLMWITTKEFVQLRRYARSGAILSSRYSNRQLMIMLIASKIIYYAVMLVVPLLVLPFAWYWVLLFFFSMHFTSGFILTTIFQTAHVVPETKYPLPDKNGTMENNWAVHQLYTTADFAPNSRILSWLIGGLNYQIEHHLFPNISHIHYRDISKIVQQLAHKYNLPYHVQPTFFKAVGRHGRMLRLLGENVQMAPVRV